MINNNALVIYELIFSTICYVIYFIWMFLGQYKRKRVRIFSSIIMVILVSLIIIRELSSVNSVITNLDLVIILIFGLIKGVYLSKRKNTEEIKGICYMYYDRKYINAWIVFFLIKLFLIMAIEIMTGKELPIGHMLLYYCLYHSCKNLSTYRLNLKVRKNSMQLII